MNWYEQNLQYHTSRRKLTILTHFTPKYGFPHVQWILDSKCIHICTIKHRLIFPSQFNVQFCFRKLVKSINIFDWYFWLVFINIIYPEIFISLKEKKKGSHEITQYFTRQHPGMSDAKKKVARIRMIQRSVFSCLHSQIVAKAWCVHFSGYLFICTIIFVSPAWHMQDLGVCYYFSGGEYCVHVCTCRNVSFMLLLPVLQLGVHSEVIWW